METQKNQVVESLKKATNILVTVSANPSVDQLAGAIGLTLLLNRLNKHATAVFSGSVPSILEFLQPDKTLEKNTDSLRDFIIALDKSKADKLRYKVEDQMVKIFITPYMTSISDKDLEFSQGDFNVEVVLALGVNEQKDLDQAITTHGRILHDATVIGVNNREGSSLGSINWVDVAASSLCEMLTQLGISLKADVLDSQMATALLTGIVAETNRFSNEKTSSETMQVSAKLMSAGADQQLVASQLQPPAPEPTVPEEADSEDLQLPEIKEEPDQQTDPQPALQADEPAELPAPATPESSDGTLLIKHGEAEISETEPTNDEPIEAEVEQIHIDADGTLKPLTEPIISTSGQDTAHSSEDTSSSTRLMMEPPTLGGTLTANTTSESESEDMDPSADILGTTAPQGPMLSHTNNIAPMIDTPKVTPLPTLTSSEPTSNVIEPSSQDAEPQLQTLADLEDLVTGGGVDSQTDVADSPQEELPPQIIPDTHVDAARDAVTQAVAGSPSQTLPPVQSLNAQPMDLNLGDMPAVSTSLASAFASNSSAPSLDNPPTINPTTSEASPNAPLEPPVTNDDSLGDSSGTIINPSAPPPVPPPMMPPGQFTT